MNIEQLLAETFAEHEDLAPNESDVRAVIDERLTAPRRAYTRPLAVAASVLVVAGAAVATALGTSGGTSHTPATTPTSCHASDRTPSRFGSLTMPYVLGYLPRGTIEWTVRDVLSTGSVTHQSLAGGYQLNVAGYYVDVQPNKASPHSIAGKPGVNAVRIGGRLGYQSTTKGADASSSVLFRDARGGILQVLVSPDASDPSRAETTNLPATALQIARGVSFRTTATVPPEFGLGDLPAAFRVVGFVVQGGRSGCATDPGTEPDETMYEVDTGAGAGQLISIGTNLSEPAQPADRRQVQGHRTRYGVHGGYRVLQVLDAVHGETVTLTAKTASRQTLYSLADHLHLPKG